MKVILLQDVKKVGRKYEVKEVANGYAQNNLIPKKLAIPATPEAKKKLEQQIHLAEKGEAEAKSLLLDTLQKINGERIEVKVKANDKGSLYAKLHAQEVAQYIHENQKVAIDPGYITLEKGMITELGEHTITITAFDTTVTCTLILSAD